jgi:ferric-dicitrate binding protein FerR (iron transport regulator)
MGGAVRISIVRLVTGIEMTKTDSWRVTVQQVLESLAKVLSALAVLITAMAPLIGPARHYLASHTDTQTVVAFSDCAPLGGHKLISLSDGSTVDLNTDSHMSAVISAKERAVRLESGEAVFEVASDRNRPFTVKVGHVQVRVLGTRFDLFGGEINPYTGERVTRIVVLDGAIQVTRDDTSAQSIIHLTAGQQIEIPDDRTKVAQIRSITEAAAGRLTAWQHGAIEFEDRPLNEVFAEYARYQPLGFASKDPEILHQRFTGVFHTNDLGPLLKSLENECIRTTYDEGGQRIVLSRFPGKRSGDRCR